MLEIVHNESNLLYSDGHRLLIPAVRIGEQLVLQIQINRTASSSMATALGIKPRQHFTSGELVHLIGEDAFGSAYTFCFVRNPFERMISFWSYQRAGEHTRLSFTEFIRAALIDKHPDLYKARKYFAPCTYWIGTRAINFIGSFEHLKRDWGLLCKQLGVSVQLPHERAVARGDYCEYYDAKTRKIVERHFEIDLDTFGYTF